MNQYRLTRRGKLVILSLLLLLIFTLVLGSRALFPKLLNQPNDNQALNPSTSIGIITVVTEVTSENTQTSTQASEVTTTAEATTTLDNQVQGIVTSEDERILLNASTLILFEQDKAELSDDMKSKIRAFARTASAYKDFEITIRGVALKLIDIQKSEENAILRANAVSQYLTSLGYVSNKVKIETKIVDHSDYESSELSKAIAAELFFSGYQKEMK